VLAVLRNQYKAGVWPIVNGLGPRVANAVGKVVSETLVDVDEQAIVLRVPAGSRFKVDGNWKRTHAGGKRANDGYGAIDVLWYRGPMGIKGGNLAGGIGMVHVEEAAEGHATNMQAADANGRVVPRFKFDGGAGLDSVRVLVIFDKADDDGRAEERAA